MEIKKIIFSFLIVDAIFAIFIFLYGGESWFLNSQIAFFSSIGVTISSFYSYQKMILSKMENGLIPKERDILDKIDDKYELYDEEDKNREIKEEKRVSKTIKESIGTLKLTSKAFLSIYRILAYLLVILGFFILQKSNIFIILPYLLGLIVVPFVATFSFLIIKREE